MQRHVSLIKAVVFAISLVLLTAVGNAQEPGQKTFATPQDAGKALYEAIKSGDKAAMEAVLARPPPVSFLPVTKCRIRIMPNFSPSTSSR